MSHGKYNSDRSIRFTRKARRLSTHNYAWSGTYFITVRVREMEPLLERAELRAILERTWYALPDRYPGLTLDEFVIMPDHVHFIIHLEGNVDKPATLGQVVGSYKSIAVVSWLHYIETNKIHAHGRFWQNYYYDRVIRNDEELEYTRQYIRNNPTKTTNNI